MASIRERNGKFNVIYSYTDADGKRKQKWETYATKAEAKKRKKEIEYKEEMEDYIKWDSVWTTAECEGWREVEYKNKTYY